MSEQLEFFTIDNPCIDVCRVDSKGYCEGCMRSREERFNWQSMSQGQKKDVLRLCAQRLLRRQRIQHKSDDNESEQFSLF